MKKPKRYRNEGKLTPLKGVTGKEMRQIRQRWSYNHIGQERRPPAKESGLLFCSFKFSEVASDSKQWSNYLFHQRLPSCLFDKPLYLCPVLHIYTGHKSMS